jgi:hypothetical protein
MRKSIVPPGLVYHFYHCFCWCIIVHWRSDTIVCHEYKTSVRQLLLVCEQYILLSLILSYNGIKSKCLYLLQFLTSFELK